MAVTANAGQVTSTFTAGDTLTATKMTEIKDAVNDNDSRVGAIETQTQNLATGCVAGQSIRAINQNGSVTCEVDTDTDTTYTAGAGISISGTTISARVGGDISVNPPSVSVAQGSTAVTQVASITIVVPSSGYVLVTHSGYVVTFNEPNTIVLGIGDTNNSIDTEVRVGSLDDASSRRYEYAYSTQNLYTAAAGTHTYYGLAQKNTVFNAGNINVVPQSISAIFIPNKY